MQCFLSLTSFLSLPKNLFSVSFFVAAFVGAFLSSTLTASASGTCNPSVQLVSTSVNSNNLTATIRNNSSTTVRVQLFTLRKYSASNTDNMTPNEAYNTSGLGTMTNGQVTISTSFPCCASVVVLKIETLNSRNAVTNTCSTTVKAFAGNGFCQKCNKCNDSCTKPSPTPTPKATPSNPVLPVCDAGGPYTASPCSTTPVSLKVDGSKSFHPYGDGLFYQWTTNCPGGSFSNSTAASPNLTLITAPNSPSEPAVNCKVNLTVRCSTGPSVSCSSDVIGQTCIRDCAGTINGSAVVDRCGVCNGDGQSCLGCSSANITANQLAIDSNANAIRDGILKINRELQSAGRNAQLSRNEAQSLSNFMQNSNAQANRVYKEVWTLTYSAFPSVIVSCAAAFCVNVSNVSSKNQVASGNNALVNLAARSEARLKTIERNAKRKRSPKIKAISASATRARRLLNQVRSLNAASSSELGRIPSTQSSCN